MNKPLSEIMCASDIQTLDTWLLLVEKVKALEQSIKEKDEMIEKMKCCSNCTWFEYGSLDNKLCNDAEYDGSCGWKLKEKNNEHKLLNK